ncbi:hypothetical protein IGI04_000758, partial [Brassica rapa subsp. trilocularis]
VSGEGFVAREICIRNTVGPKKEQAVALRVSSDRAVFYRCSIDAYQDTLYAHKYQQFYRECQITGTVNFICGHATAVFQNCQIEARRPLIGQSNVIAPSYCLVFPSRLLLSFTDSEGKIVVPSSTPKLKMVVDKDVPA